MRGEGRPQFEQDIEKRITGELARYYIIVEEFVLRDIRLPHAIENAIQEKKAAEQKVITEQFNLQAQAHIANQTRVNAEAEAQAAIATAKGQAEAIVIAAQAQKNATVIVADGDKEAISRLIDAMGGNGSVNASTALQAYIEYLFIEAINNPDSPIEFYLIPVDENGIPILLETGD